MTYRIRLVHQFQEVGARLVNEFRIDSQNRDPLLLVRMGVPAHTALHLFPAERGSIELVAARTVVVAGLPRIEAGLRDGSFRSAMEKPPSEQAVDLNISGEEFEALARAPEPKLCRYQNWVGGDLFCEACVDSRSAERRSCPTSMFMCSQCPLPDDRAICTHLRHGRVVHAGTTPARWSMSSAFCDLGNQKSGAEWGACCCGGHPCWERVVETSEPQDVAHLSPLALHEAIDYLDAIWRTAMKAPLLKYDVLAVGGTLATPCAGKDDFQLKVSAVVDAFDGFQVAGKKGGTLERMTEQLRSWSAGKSVANDDFATVEEAIGVLKKVARLRAGLLHGGDRARGDLEEAQRALGVSLPAVSYAEEWHQLVVRVTSALAVVRQHVRRYGRDGMGAPPAA